MKTSHYTTPRTLGECEFYNIGYATKRRDESSYRVTDLAIVCIFFVVLFLVLTGIIIK